MAVYIIQMRPVFAYSTELNKEKNEDDNNDSPFNVDSLLIRCSVQWVIVEYGRMTRVCVCARVSTIIIMNAIYGIEWI